MTNKCAREELNLYSANREDCPSTLVNTRLTRYDGLETGSKQVRRRGQKRALVGSYVVHMLCKIPESAVWSWARDWLEVWR